MFPSIQSSSRWKRQSHIHLIHRPKQWPVHRRHGTSMFEQADNGGETKLRAAFYWHSRSITAMAKTNLIGNYSQRMLSKMVLCTLMLCTAAPAPELANAARNQIPALAKEENAHYSEQPTLGLTISTAKIQTRRVDLGPTGDATVSVSSAANKIINKFFYLASPNFSQCLWNNLL